MIGFRALSSAWLPPAGLLKAGIQANDVLLSVDGKPAISAQETMDQVAEIRPGSVVDVQVLRNDKKLTLPVTILEFPDNSQ